jgi:transcriptional regulator with XRE-family HTH domain
MLIGMNWKTLIEELEARGLTQTDIAEQSGCSQPYVSQLKSGVRKNPDFTRGQALVELHKKHAESAGTTKAA